MGQAAEKHSEGLGTGIDIGVKAEHIMTSRERCQEQDILGFERRHLGPREGQLGEMCAFLGYNSLSQLIDAAVPASIRLKGAFQSEVFAAPLREHEALSRIQNLSQQNKTKRSFIGMGYHDTLTPTVILRNVFENPGWYTQYTPYQPEISQGRLEALLNFQTMISDLTGLPIVNASLLDEATAAAEAMTLSYGVKNKAGSDSSADKFFVSDGCHPQVIEVVKTRGEAVGIQVEVGSLNSFKPGRDYFGALFAYPTTNGSVIDIAPYIRDAHKEGLVVTVTTDPLALLLLKSPGSLGADVVVGSAQRFGVPLGFGGPHAAYMATKDEFKRVLPGRLVGVSRDATGKRALRLSLQTREQHIRREKATSNICTAQVLLANMAGMYAVYHGPVGLRKIAEEVHAKAALLVDYLTKAGVKLENDSYFDTLTVLASKSEQQEIKKRADAADVLFRYYVDGRVGISMNETTTLSEVYDLAVLLTGKKGLPPVPPEVVGAGSTVHLRVPAAVVREDEPLSHTVFNRYHSESEFLRYIKLLEGKDISLTHSMIPLGSCTMKLNATSEMIPVTYPGFSALHPFAPLEDTKGYLQLFQDLEQALQEVTGFDAVSLQPNAGSQGEYAGLLAIRGYHLANNQAHRNVCLIPVSAHGTNPASAVMVGMQVVIIKCDDAGNIDLEDLKAKADEHRDNLAALMVTYPSTHGVFETTVQEACNIIHERGGQVYLDGANLNALVGLSRPGDIGADVCHINLHKTFCIPHGGGGPGMGPIGVKKHLQPFLPGHLFAENVLGRKEGAVSAAPWGSASILPISWMYMAMMGASGMQRATEIAILNANYIAKRLENHYPILYRGANGLVAHECILDARPLKESAGVEAVDIAKRLMDYGFHAPTMSWPVAGTLMVEPTESESKEELDRFCDAMIAIAEEAKRIERGEWPRDNNPLKNAPHTAVVVMSDTWDRPYSREVAAFPVHSLRDNKFWPSVSRIEESYGDRNLVCTCPAVEEYA